MDPPPPRRHAPAARVTAEVAADLLMDQAELAKTTTCCGSAGRSFFGPPGTGKTYLAPGVLLSEMRDLARKIATDSLS